MKITKNEAEDILEWRLALLQADVQCAECGMCGRLQKRIEKFLGKKRTEELKWLMKEFPYFGNK